MDCRMCGTRLEEGERACPSCLAYVDWESAPRPIAVEVVPGPPEGEPVALEDGGLAVVAPGNSAIAGAAPEIAAVAEAAPQAPPDQPCPAHPDKAVAGVCGRCGTFICRECDPDVALPSALCAACRARLEAGPSGIGGWLILPAIWCVVGPLLSGLSTFHLLYLMDENPTDDLLVAALLYLGLTVYASFTSVQFFRKRSSVPRLMVIWLVVQLVMGLLAFVGADEEEGGADLLWALVNFAIWTPYFLSSKRVKATFVR